MGPAAAGWLPLSCHCFAPKSNDKAVQGCVERALVPSRRKASAARPPTAPLLAGHRGAQEHKSLGSGQHEAHPCTLSLHALMQASLLPGFEAKWCDGGAQRVAEYSDTAARRYWDQANAVHASLPWRALCGAAWAGQVARGVRCQQRRPRTGWG